MSLYNMINGVNQIPVFFILPMLGKHPDEYPRFRNCFNNDDEHPEYKDKIHIYTRTGGNNRVFYEQENKEMATHPEYVTDYDDSHDSTYASWIFNVPKKWSNDYEKIKKGEIEELSKSYQKQVRKVYPKLKDELDELWG